MYLVNKWQTFNPSYNICIFKEKPNILRKNFLTFFWRHCHTTKLNTHWDCDSGRVPSESSRSREHGALCLGDAAPVYMAAFGLQTQGPYSMATVMNAWLSKHGKGTQSSCSRKHLRRGFCFREQRPGYSTVLGSSPTAAGCPPEPTKCIFYSWHCVSSASRLEQ